MRPNLLVVLALLMVFAALPAALAAAERPALPPGAQSAGGKATIPIYIAVHWHMHQPIYWPYEDIVATSRNPQNTLDVLGVLSWPDRVGAYTHYPPASVGQFLDLPDAGAQVSFSGSLIEDLDAMAAAGITFGKDWPNEYRSARSWRTAAGNPRLDLVAFGYYHPLMAFLDYDEIRWQVSKHREVLARTFGGPVSKGIFPPENAFTPRMVPALVDEGLQWVLVDNLHMDRACKGYPYSAQQKIPPANPADERNPAQAEYVPLQSQTNAMQSVGGVGLRPHWVEFRQPGTGQARTPEGRPSRMIVVPTERSLGYDDSYGDRSPLPRLQQLECLNNDPKHPLLVVLAHDGDNFGASGSRYYLDTMRWARENPDRYIFTTVQDYLDRFPPEVSDVIHVEDGSWSGADLGDQTFGKWLAPPYRAGVIDPVRGWSSDWDSWASMVAARNWLRTASATAPGHAATARAERYFHVGLTSCYWYWDGQKQWDMKPTMAANEVVKAAHEVLGKAPASDTQPPSLFPPQRFPYNPGFTDGGRPLPPRFSVYTLAYDAGSLKSVVLQVKSHPGREVAPDDTTYAGDWTALPMTVQPMLGTSAIPALAKADRYWAAVDRGKGQLVSYFVEAVDGQGNRARSDVFVAAVGDGTGGGGGGSEGVPWTPAFPRQHDPILVKAPRKATLHWGVNGWTCPPRALWPAGTTAWPDGKAVESPMTPAPDGTASVTVGPVSTSGVETLEFVFHFADGTWGRDQVITVSDPMRLWHLREKAVQQRDARRAR